MTKLSNPTPIFLDRRGALLDAGFIYIGLAGHDPETDPIQLYWDAARTIAAPQPLRTLGGVIVNGANAAFVYMAESDYSMRVRDAGGVIVGPGYIPSTSVVMPDYQPLDSDLSAIAALSTTTFGRALLTLANAAALKTATGIPDCLPLTGGSVTGNVVRSGAGVLSYYADAAMTGGRIYITAAGAADPTSQPGDAWYTY